MRRHTFACLALLLVAAPVRADDAPFASLAALDAAIAEVDRGGDPERLWSRVVAARNMPLVFGETAVFLHRSRAAAVEWRADWNGWTGGPDATGRRVGTSDIFTWRRDFDPAARLDYKIVEITGGKETWILDPLSPHQQVGGYGPNSELRMPEWTAPAHVVRRPGVARGRFAPPRRVRSKALGYEVTVRVYEPAVAGGARGPLPILYVTDGSDYWREEMGALVVTLDNLIADKRIAPLVVVFIDPWDPAHRENRREKELLPVRDGDTIVCRFCEFLVGELAPRVERGRRIDVARRGILGTSYGGFFAAYLGHREPGFVRLLGIQSPALARPWALEGLAERAAPARVAISVGSYEPRAVPGARLLREAYTRAGVAVHTREVPEGHSWGHWRATVAELLEFLYPPR